MNKEREMKDSGIPWIGEIPKDWEVVHIKHYCNNVYAGGTPQSNNLAYWDGNIPWIPSGSCQNNIITEAPKFITQEGFENSSTKLIPPYTTVMAMTGATCSNTGYVTFQTCMNQSVVAFIQKDDVFSKYLYYTLQAAKQEILTHQTGGAQSGINVEDCKNIIIPYISFEEQTAIAEFLDRKCGEIDELVALQEKMIEELKAYKQSIITETVTGKNHIGRTNRASLQPIPMKDSRIEWIGEIPQHWEVKPLKMILKRPLQYGANESGISYVESLPRYVRITDITNNKLREDVQKLSLTENQAKDYILEEGDILFARSGATVGKTFLFNSKYGRCAYAGYLIRAQINLFNLPKYIFYYTQCSVYEEWKSQIFIQATIQNIGGDRYSLLPIILPPLSEQQEIADFLDKKCSEIDSLIELKQQKIEELKDFKKSIIYEYVTGKKQVEINEI